jgi:hypothetical protein
MRMPRSNVSLLVLATALPIGLVAGFGSADAPARESTHSITITSGPTGTVTFTTATFTFVSTEAATFTCTLDTAAATPCGSRLGGVAVYTGLAAGSHRFSVVATVDRDGHTASAERTWTIVLSDRSPPDTTITKAIAGPMATDGTMLPLSLSVVPLNVATFGFEAGEPSTFACTLDGQPTPCVSPQRLPHILPGAHRFAVRATDLAGNTDPTAATVDWRVGSVVASAAPHPRKLKARGPRLLRRRDILAFARLRSPRGEPDEEEADEYEAPAPKDEPGDSDCRLVPCPGRGVSGARGEAGKRTAAAAGPPLVAGPFTSGLIRNIDPNIAASTTALVVTTGGTITFYAKDGTLLTDGNGNAIQPFAASLFFQPFFDPADPKNLNTGLNLPKGLKCDPTVSSFDGDPNTPGLQPLSKKQTAATRDCLREVYDSRVIFDDFRKRFWIVSAARNDTASHYQDLADQASRVGRRTRQLVAVSLDADPRNGWYMYSWNGEVDDGACNTIPVTVPVVCPGTQYIPGDAADYPSIGISKDYVVTTMNVTNFGPIAFNGPGYTNITAFDADGLASGGCKSTCGWTYGRLDGGFIGPSPGLNLGTVDHTVQPAVHHDVAPQGYTLMAANYPEYDFFLVLGFRKAEGAIAPPVHVALVPVDPEVTDVNELPQRPAGTVKNPAMIRVGNLDATAMKAVARGGGLIVTWMDCKSPVPLSPCTTMARLAGFDAPAALANGLAPTFLDGGVGMNDPDDTPGVLVSSGNPAIEVNKLGDIVVVYTRSSTKTFLQARYSALVHPESTLRTGRTLKAGNFPYNATDPDNGKNYVLNLDTGGIAVDPKDGVGVWMLHAFSFKSDEKGDVDFAFGKVFGARYFNIAIEPGLVSLDPANVLPGGKVRLLWKVENDGDGASPASKGTIELVGRKRRIRLGSFSLRPLKPRATASFRRVVQLPEKIDPGVYQLELALPSSRKEYGAKDNRARRALRIGVAG